MAALKVSEPQGGRLVMTPALRPRLGSLVSTLVWFGLLGLFFVSSVGDRGIDLETLVFVVFMVVFVFGGSLLGALLVTQVIVDRTSRTVTSVRRFVGVPLATTTLPFSDIANVEYQYYRQSSGRSSHEAWRVNLITRDQRRIPINWDGRADEMAALAQKVTALTGSELVDRSEKQVSTVQQILDTMSGRTDLPEAAPPVADGPQTGAAPGDISPTSPEASPAGSPGGLDAPAPPPPALPWSSWDTSTVPPRAASPEIEVAPAGVQSTEQMAKLATPDLEQLVKNDPMDSLARQVLARRYHAGGRLDRAVTLYQEVMRIDPMNVDAQNDLGVALEQQRKRTEAEAAYRRAIALDPFSSSAHLNLALLLRSMNRAAEASSEFYQARQHARTDAESRAAEAASSGGKVGPQLSAIQR